ncbi:MAG: type II toxin-antitoxin system RelE/ParE family toxin [Candidatus Pacearchaeota archaeon]|nr:type II toxin-antitoxin system RelE/ParE family toxin [Candidatus Pacearchaeota archaeon]
MYSLNLDKNAKIFLKKLDKPEQERILDKLEDLKKNPELGKPLTGNLAGLWSLRIGDYRAIYQIRNLELLILVLKLGHRKNIYS